MPTLPEDAGAAADVPKELRTARTLAWVHFAVGVVGVLLFVASVAALSGDSDRAEAFAAAAPPAGALAAIGGILSVLSLAALVVLAVNANKLPRLRPAAQTWIIAAEVVIGLAALVGIIGALVGPGDRDELPLEQIVAAAGAGDVEGALLSEDDAKVYGQLDDDTKFEAPLDAAGEQALRAALQASDTPFTDDEVAGSAVVGVVYAVVSLALAAAVLWFLTRPHVRATFAAARRAEVGRTTLPR